MMIDAHLVFSWREFFGIMIYRKTSTGIRRTCNNASHLALSSDRICQWQCHHWLIHSTIQELGFYHHASDVTDDKTTESVAGGEVAMTPQKAESGWETMLRTTDICIYIRGQHPTLVYWCTQRRTGPKHNLEFTICFEAAAAGISISPCSCSCSLFFGHGSSCCSTFFREQEDELQQHFVSWLLQKKNMSSPPSSLRQLLRRHSG
jgi:hypothetical protein